MELNDAIKDVIRVWGRNAIATPHVFVFLMAKNAFEGNLQQMQIFNKLLDMGFTDKVLKLYGDNEWNTKLSSVETDVCAKLSSSFNEHQVKLVFRAIVKGVFDKAHLGELIRRVLMKEGIDAIMDFRIVNILDDSHAFQDDKRSKQIFKTMIDRGDIKKIVRIGCWNKQAQDVCDTFVHETGYESEQVAQIFQSIAYGLGYL